MTLDILKTGIKGPLHMQNLQNMYLVRTASDLDADIQEQILQDVPENRHRYFTDPDGGFNWRTLPPGIGAQITRHIPRTRVDLRGVIVAAPNQAFDRIWFAPTLVDLSVVGSGPAQAWTAVWRSRAANPLQVTFSQRLNRESLERTWEHIENHDPEEDEYVQDYYAGFPPRRTGHQLDELAEQVQRTYVQTVYAIRLIRHDGSRYGGEWRDFNLDEFSVELVRRGAHGEEVIALDELLAVEGVTTPGDPNFRLDRAQRDELARQLTTTLGMRHRVMPERGYRERRNRDRRPRRRRNRYAWESESDDDYDDDDDDEFDANGEEWSV